jgi:hypothetical protein
MRAAATFDIQAEAERLAAIAMGTTIVGGGRGRRVVKHAEQDPLAWWCLTEALVQFGERARDQGAK